MKQGAILVSSIELTEKVLKTKDKTSFEIKNFFRRNKFAGAKDKKQIKDLLFKFLKNYFTIKKICKNNLIKFSTRNGLLIYYFFKYKEKNLDDIYEGKFSLKPEIQDKKIYKTAKNLKNNICPSLPNWLEDKLSSAFKENLDENYKSILEEPRFDIRVNKLFTNVEKVLLLLLKNNIQSTKTDFSPIGITINKRTAENKIRKIKKDFFEVQDEGSQIVTLLSGAKEKMKILDYCAGKGTKTLAIYNQIRGKGEIHVNDINPFRVKVLKKRFEKLNIKNEIKLFNNKKKFENYFDLILLDVPCSGSGVWRRKPENLVKLDTAKYKKNLITQKKLLKEVTKYCKKDGLISYITCSLFEDENESQIIDFLNENKAFKVLNINIKLNSALKNFTLKKKYKWFNITPTHMKTDSFFICLLKKYD